MQPLIHGHFFFQKMHICYFMQTLKYTLICPFKNYKEIRLSIVKNKTKVRCHLCLSYILPLGNFYKIQTILHDLNIEGIKISYT